jgi:hypothetical protein
MRFASGLFAVLTAMSALSAFGAPRTFVASSGKDTNPCTVDKPCRTFAAAITQTDVNGQVIAVDSAGFGPFALTSAGVSVIGAPGVHAAVTAVGSGDAITINGPTNGVIVLRNLYITSDGAGSATGINVSSGGSFTIDHCFISGTSSTAIKIQLVNTALIAITDTVAQQTYTGVFIDGPGLPIVTMDHCRVTAVQFAVWVNAGDVLLRDSTIDYAVNEGLAVVGTTPKVTIDNCSFSHAPAALYAAGGIVALRNSTVTSNYDGIRISGGALSVDSCIISGNGGVGVQAYPGDISIANSTISDNGVGVYVAFGAVRLNRNSITRNGTGISIGAGTAYSTGDNMVDGNTTNISGGTTTPATKM